MVSFTGARAPGAARVAGAASACLCLLLCAAPYAATPIDLFGDSKDFTEEPSPPPAPPTEADLTAVYRSPINQFRFLVDKSSIALGKDGVVRFTLVAVSPEGVKNVVYEGMRCADGTYKRYDFLTDGKWQRSHNTDWHSVDERDGSGAQRPLFDHVFCTDGFPLNLTAVLDRLQKRPFQDIPY